jgi:hypothetical protein
MRQWTEKVYGIPPEQVIGSSTKSRFEIRGGKPVIMISPEINFIDDNAGKLLGVRQEIGRSPIAAFNNSDGGLPALQWTNAGKGAGSRFSAITPTLCTSGPATVRPLSAGLTRRSTKRRRKGGRL